MNGQSFNSLRGSAAPVMLRGHEGRVFDIAFEGRPLDLTGAYDGTVRLWHLKLADLVDVACEVAGRELTAEVIGLFLGGAQAQRLCSGDECPASRRLNLLFNRNSHRRARASG